MITVDDLAYTLSELRKNESVENEEVVYESETDKEDSEGYNTGRS